MKTKQVHIRASEEFLDMLAYLQQQNGYKNQSETIRKVVENEYRKGKWIHKGCGIFSCNKCGKDVGLNVYTSEEASEKFKFCPNCGADMRETNK